MPSAKVGTTGVTGPAPCVYFACSHPIPVDPYEASATDAPRAITIETATIAPATSGIIGPSHKSPPRCCSLCNQYTAMIATGYIRW